MKFAAAVCGFLMCMASITFGAGTRLTMKVSPGVAFAPANLVVRATIEADADNRAIAIVAESDDFYRSSEIQLDGDHAPRVTMFEFRSLPPGTYQVRATLIGKADEPRAIMRQQVNVMSGAAGQ